APVHTPKRTPAGPVAGAGLGGRQRPLDRVRAHPDGSRTPRLHAHALASGVHALAAGERVRPALGADRAPEPVRTPARVPLVGPVRRARRAGLRLPAPAAGRGGPPPGTPGAARSRGCRGPCLSVPASAGPLS